MMVFLFFLLVSFKQKNIKNRSLQRRAHIAPLSAFSDQPKTSRPPRLGVAGGASAVHQERGGPGPGRPGSRRAPGHGEKKRVNQSRGKKEEKQSPPGRSGHGR